jgi:hypothetical protein
LIRRDGKLTPATWEEAFALIGTKFAEVRERDGGPAIGVVGSTRTTNEEDYLLSKFARVVLKTNNVDHHRTADFPALAAACRGKNDITASMAEVFTAPAILLIGNDPTEQHPLLAWQIRNNVRLHQAKLYVINSNSIKLRRQATGFIEIPAGSEPSVAALLAGGKDAAYVPAGTALDKDKSFEVGALGKFAAARSPTWFSLAPRFPGQNLSASPIMPIHAAQPTWGYILICFPDITPSQETVNFSRNGAKFRRRRDWISPAWLRPEKRAS